MIGARIALAVSLFLAAPLCAQPLVKAEQRKRAAAEVLASVADCAVKLQPLLAAELVSSTDLRQTSAPGLKRALETCLTANRSATRVVAQGMVVRGLLGMAFVRHPERLPAGLHISPLPATPVADSDIVLAVSACIVAADPAGARRFAEAVPGLPEEQAAFAAIADLSSRCIAPWPQLAINGPLLRAGLGIGLFRALVPASAG